jgi:hypothetical protein
MNNIETRFDGDKLIITIDVSKKTIQEAGMSKSMKNKLLATTHGHISLDRSMTLNLNLMTKEGL